MRNWYKNIGIVLLLISLTNCSDVLSDNPPDVINSKNIFQDASGFDTALNGLYAQVVRIRGGEDYGSSNHLMSSLMDAGTDIMYAPQDNGAGKMLNSWGSRNRADWHHYRNVWNWLYEIVNGTNNVIDEAENEKIDWTDQQKNSTLATARLFRAFAYYHLTNLWGDVPLVLKHSTGSNIRFDFRRTPVDSVRDQEIKDLKFAMQYLPETPPVPGKVTKGVAQTYLAMVYLEKAGKRPPYNQADLTNARDVAKDLLDNGPFSLVTQRYGVEKNEPGTPYTDMFIDGNSTYDEGNTGCMWSFQNEYSLRANARNSNIMRRWHVNRYHVFGLAYTAERGGRGRGRLGPTNFMMELYGPNDDRGSKFAWRRYYIYKEYDDVPDTSSVGDTVFVYWKGIPEEEKDSRRPSPRKWDSTHPEEITDSRQFDDQAFMRIDQAYLLLAEAQYKLNNSNAAATTVNILRDRAHAPRISASDIDMDFILDERARELYGEERRRYTLLRTGKWLERTKIGNQVAGPNIVAKDTLYPIPQDVIDANNQYDMRQNPGY